VAQQLYLIDQALADLDHERAPDVFVAIDMVGEDSGDPPLRAAGAHACSTCTGTGRASAGCVFPYCAPPRGRTMAGTSPLSPDSACTASCCARPACTCGRCPTAKGGFDRCTARVRVVAQPVEPRPAGRSEAQFADLCLGSASPSTTIVRRYREAPSPLVRDALAGWRTGRLDQVLSGDFDLMH
jgi:hypothetical protein